MRVASMTVLAVTLAGCAIYMDRERDKVLLAGIDVDQSLHVAEDELDRGTVLALWALRDQVVTPDQAARISDLYFGHIDAIDAPGRKMREFNVWHLTWAISNFYRHGSPDVKEALQDAYDDAGARVEALGLDVAKIHYGGDRIYMGDFHGLAHAYAMSHLVVPGDPDYLECYGEYVNPWKPCP